MRSAACLSCVLCIVVVAMTLFILAIYLHLQSVVEELPTIDDEFDITITYTNATEPYRPIHIYAEKSIELKENVQEYFGFYLRNGTQMNLEACTRYPGMRLLVFTCGMMHFGDFHIKSAKDTKNASERDDTVFSDDTNVELIPIYNSNKFTCYDGRLKFNSSVSTRMQSMGKNIRYFAVSNLMTLTHDILGHENYYYVFQNDKHLDTNDIHFKINIFTPDYKDDDVKEHIFTYTTKPAAMQGRVPGCRG